jgi:hypothetical protein
VDAPVPCDVITALLGAGLMEEPLEKDNTLNDDRKQLCDNFFELVPGMEKTVRITSYDKQPELRLAQIVKE